jgi:hypothetical protein
MPAVTVELRQLLADHNNKVIIFQLSHGTQYLCQVHDIHRRNTPFYLWDPIFGVKKSMDSYQRVIKPANRLSD